MYHETNELDSMKSADQTLSKGEEDQSMSESTSVVGQLLVFLTIMLTIPVAN
jgi:hypothetical protein